MPTLEITITAPTEVLVAIFGGEQAASSDNQLTRGLARIESVLHASFQKLEKNMARLQNELNALRTEVEELRTVNEGGVKLIEGLSAKLDEIADDPAEIRAFAESLRQSKTLMAEAIAKHTKAETETGGGTSTGSGGSGSTPDSSTPGGAPPATTDELTPPDESVPKRRL